MESDGNASARATQIGNAYVREDTQMEFERNLQTGPNYGGRDGTSVISSSLSSYADPQVLSAEHYRNQHNQA